MNWGLLGVESLSGTRRVRTLGLGAIVRRFNDLAVPGMGNSWFARQFVLALLGVHLAEKARAAGNAVSNIAAANGVEALAVWAAFERNGWTPDERLPGIRKLKHQSSGVPPLFKRAASRAFYVTQPMRIRTVQGLAALGFVKAPNTRFNTYGCTDLGRVLLAAVCPLACDKLLGWVTGQELPRKRRHILREIDPTQELPTGAGEILRESIVRGSIRRRDVLAWVETLVGEQRDYTDWDRQPEEITDPKHWADMLAGARFTAVIDAAAGEGNGGSVLARVERRMLVMGTRRIAWDEAADASLGPALELLRTRSAEFLAAKHDPSIDGQASRFCRECIGTDDAEVLRHLVARDLRVLRPGQEGILAGPAFLAAASSVPDVAAVDEVMAGEGADEPSDVPSEAMPGLPIGISRRIRNLMYLARDLRSEGASAKAVR